MSADRAASALVALVVCAAGVSAQAPVPKAAVATRMAAAQRIAGKMRTTEQQRFALSKIGPIFAAQVIASLRSGGPNPLQAKLGSDAGQAEVAAVLTQEFGVAFEKRLPELQTAVAAELADRMSDADLKATDAFLDTPAGASWAAAMVGAQIQSSVTGQRIGSEAGGEAVQAAMKRLAGSKP